MHLVVMVTRLMCHGACNGGNVAIKINVDPRYIPLFTSDVDDGGGNLDIAGCICC